MKCVRVARELEVGDVVWVPFVGWRRILDVMTEVRTMRLELERGIRWRIGCFARMTVKQ